MEERLSHLLAEDKEGFVKALARTRANISEENLSNPCPKEDIRSSWSQTLQAASIILSSVMTHQAAYVAAQLPDDKKQIELSYRP